jgi:hypothetical protein
MTDKADHAVFDADRLLAFSRFLRKGSCQFESTVLGESMGKAVPAGSMIRIRFASDSNLKTGQIVAYISDDRIVAHRLVKITRSRGDHFVITCGDATVCCDVPVRVSAVIGILTELRGNGTWKPAPQQQARSFGSRIAVELFSSMVMVVLWVNPHCSKWVAARIIEMRAVALRVVGVVKRYARREPPKEAIG